jgi:hypothetical protein
MRLDFLRFEGARLRVKLAGLRTYLRPLVPGGDLADLPDMIAASSGDGVEPPPFAARVIEVIEGREDAVVLITAPEIAQHIRAGVPGVEVVSIVIATGADAGALRALVGALELEIKAPIGLLVEPS